MKQPLDLSTSRPDTPEYLVALMCHASAAQGAAMDFCKSVLKSIVPDGAESWGGAQNNGIELVEGPIKKLSRVCAWPMSYRRAEPSLRPCRVSCLVSRLQSG